MPDVNIQDWPLAKLLRHHPGAVHVCSLFIYVHVTRALGGAMSHAHVDVPNSY
jgi:hypothetical protein